MGKKIVQVACGEQFSLVLTGKEKKMDWYLNNQSPVHFNLILNYTVIENGQIYAFGSQEYGQVR